MDEEKTAPFELGKGAPCLLIHGFTGSPWDLRPLGEALAARGYHVRCPLLPGHGTTPEAMEDVRSWDWTHTALQALESFDGPVFVCGFSMGALLALLLAVRRPEKVRALALLAPAAKFLGPSMFLARRLRRWPVLEAVQPWVKKTDTDIHNTLSVSQAPLLPAFPTARLRDLFRLQDEARSHLSDVRCPALIVMAAQDHVVSLEGGKLLARGLVHARPLRFIRLARGFHILPRDDDATLVFDEVHSFFQAVAQRDPA